MRRVLPIPYNAPDRRISIRRCNHCPRSMAVIAWHLWWRLRMRRLMAGYCQALLLSLACYAADNRDPRLPMPP